MRDLSHPIRSGMQVYPGDPAVDLEPALELDRDGAAVTTLHLGSHSGTHVDAPAHTVAGGRTMDAVALDELVGDALVLHVPGLADHATIGVDDLGELPGRVPSIVVVDTGWAVQRLPAGFQKIAELKRNMPGRPAPVSQMVYTDGLATLSIFVEPNATPPRAAEAASEDGTTAFFVRPVGDFVVSVLGEVPPATAQQIARSVTRRP